MVHPDHLRMRVNCPGRVNGPNASCHFAEKQLKCQVREVAKVSKKTAVTYDEVFRFLSGRNERYAEGCTETRKRSGFQRTYRRLEDGVLFYYEDKEDSEEQTSVDR